MLHTFFLFTIKHGIDQMIVVKRQKHFHGLIFFLSKHINTRRKGCPPTTFVKGVSAQISMKVLRTIRNYFCYCGIEKDQYRELKKDAYVSNFRIWRVLHLLMIPVFAALFISSMSMDIIVGNRYAYLALLIYSVIASVLFLFVLKKDSIVPQLLIYLSMSMLFVFGGLISQNRPENPASSFLVFLIVFPMFVIDKPYFMTIELVAASSVFLVWMQGIKSPVAWQTDVLNVTVYTIVGIFLHVISSSIRIKEFVLSRQLAIQKDTDDLTGLMNKGAITRGKNENLADKSKNKGIMFLLDVDHFKAVNDTYGHDVGDSIIKQLGIFLGTVFSKEDILGRFGGDEFIVFIKNTDEAATAEKAARTIADGVAEHVLVPDGKQKISVSMGIALYEGKEKNYSEIFKKADIALYKTKADRRVKYNFYEEQSDI